MNYKNYISSFISLYANNGINYLLPLVIIPYIIKIVGLENYGYLVFGLAFSSYFKVLIDFGFDVTITKQILKTNFDSEKISEIFSVVLILKLILFIVSLIVFSSVIIFIPTINKLGYFFFFLNFIYVLSSLFNVNPFFYASHKVKFITIINGVSKILYFLSLVFFLKNPNQLNLLAFLSSMSWILPNLILFIIAIYRFNIRLKKINFKHHFEIIYESKNAFISDLAVSLYGTTNLFLMGLFFPGSITGVYGAVEKVFNAFTNIISSANYVLYPILLKNYEQFRLQFKSKLKDLEIKYLLVCLFASLIMLIFKNSVLFYLTGVNNDSITNTYYYIFVLALIFSPFGAFYTRLFLIIDCSKKLFKVTGTAFLLNLIVLSIIIFFDLYFIIPISVLFTQIYISLIKRKIVYKNI